MLYECYKEAAFNHKNSRLEVWEVFDDYIKRCYPHWVRHLRKDCFERYPELEDHYKHPPRRRNSSYLERDGKKMEYTEVEGDY